jgi:hypothetical protein
MKQQPRSGLYPSSRRLRSALNLLPWTILMGLVAFSSAPALALTEVAANAQAQIDDGQTESVENVGATGPRSAQAGFGLTSARIEADFGVIRTYAHSQWGSASNSGYFAIASGRYDDAVTYTSSAANGTTGFVTLQFRATGTLAATGPAQVSWSFQIFTNATSHFLSGLCGNGISCASPSGDQLGIIELQVPIVWGAPDHLLILFGGDVFSMGPGPGSGTADLRSTFRHLGVVAAFDADMNPVTGLSVSSESGVDWTVEVLDPPSVPAFGLFGPAALALLMVAAGWWWGVARGRPCEATRVG